MPFQSGRVSFCRFLATGDGPSSVDDTTLATLAEHSFHETAIGAPDEVEAGWITGEHLLDTQFTYEKNGFGATGSMLLCALRIDTHNVPAELKYAYRRVNEQALAADNPSGFASKAQKREAADTAGRQLHEDLAAGKFRRSKIVPVLWDFQSKMVYCGTASNKALEQLAAHFFRSFNIRLEPVTPGSLAGRLLRDSGKGRDYEDLQPSAFTHAPAAAARPEDDDNDAGHNPAIPSVPWLAGGADLKDFLGNEFLLWLWWMTETAEGLIDIPARPGSGPRRDLAIAFDKLLDTDCAWGVLGSQSLRGSGPTRMAEAGKALVTGKWPRKAGLILADASAGSQWELSFQADRWIVSGASLPEVPDAKTPRELIDARLMLTRQLADTIDDLFRVFLQARVATSWPAQRKKIRTWIIDRAEPRAKLVEA